MNYTEWWRAVSETGRCATVSHMTYFSKSFNAGEMQPQWETYETVSTEKQAHCLLTCVNEVVWTSGDMNVKAGSLTWKTWSRVITSAIVFLLFLNDSTTLITFKTWTNGKKGTLEPLTFALSTASDYLFLLRPQSFQYMLFGFILSLGIFFLAKLRSAHELDKCF